MSVEAETEGELEVSEALAMALHVMQPRFCHCCASQEVVVNSKVSVSDSGRLHFSR